MNNFIDKSLTIKWGGEDIKINITNELCNQLEANGINLFKMSVDLGIGGTPKMFLIGQLITMLLQSAGKQVNQGEVMPLLTQSAVDSVELYKFTQVFLSKVFPPVESVNLGKSSKAKK